MVSSSYKSNSGLTPKRHSMDATILRESQPSASNEPSSPSRHVKSATSGPSVSNHMLSPSPRLSLLAQLPLPPNRSPQRNSHPPLPLDHTSKEQESDDEEFADESTRLLKHHNEPDLPVFDTTDRSMPVWFHSVQVIMAVFLGIILNLLDAISYGIIIFPSNDSFIPNTAAQAGISMFLSR